MTSRSQQIQQLNAVGAGGVTNDGIQLGNNGQQVVQQGQMVGQSGGGLTTSSGSGGEVGPQPQGTN